MLTAARSGQRRRNGSSRLVSDVLLKVTIARSVALGTDRIVFAGQPGSIRARSGARRSRHAVLAAGSGLAARGCLDWAERARTSAVPCMHSPGHRLPLA